MMLPLKTFSVNYLVAAVLLAISLVAAPDAHAQPVALSIADSKARSACVSALVDNEERMMYRDLRTLTAMDILEIESCHFSEIRTSNEIGTIIANANDASLKIRRKKLREVMNKFEIAKNGIRNGFADAAEGLKAAGITQDGQYISVVLVMLGDLELNALSVGTEAWNDRANSQSYFNFIPHRLNQNVPKMSPLAFPIDVPDENWGECDDKCRAYLDFFVAAKAASNLISQAVQVKTGQLARDTEAALKEYDYYFFETGDGLYPHELWLNSLGKSDDPFKVPPGKWTLIHPTPILYYNDFDGDIEPSVMIEILGYTHLGYRTSAPEKSLPFGGAFAVDLEGDKVRLGGVVHLPIKGILANAGLDTFSEFVPCKVCSVAFMTDGDGDWSVGLKINAARIFYPDEKAKKAYKKFLK